MTKMLLILTTAGLGLCALAMAAMLRQIGLISRRLVVLGQGGREPGLVVGAELPLREFPRADGAGRVTAAAAGGEPTVLLFASLSCQLCRSLLEGLRGLDAALLDRTVLMLLDSGPWKRFSAELGELGLAGLPVVFAVDLAAAFEITMPPQIYVVGADGRVAYSGRVFSAEEFAKVAGNNSGLESVVESRGYKENELEKVASN